MVCEIKGTSDITWVSVLANLQVGILSLTSLQKLQVKDARQKIKDAEVAKLLASGNINGPLTSEDKEAVLTKVLAESERAVAAASLEKEAVIRMSKWHHIGKK